MTATHPTDYLAYEEVESWALRQVAPWIMQGFVSRDISEELERLNATEPDVFIIVLSQGHATLVDKPESIRSPYYKGAFGRADCYRGWLTEVAAELCPTIVAVLGIFVGDGALDDSSVPIFSFQKPDGNRSLLLPDVDLLQQRFPRANDELAYAEKDCRAVFAGATSGGGLLTTERVLRDGGIPRIRAALFFRGNPDVWFRIPSVVQYDSDKTLDLLRSMDIGVGERVTWPEQLKNKFVISMDGNGATCSRVAVALSSNSVLLKYSSPHILYYFDGLRPWRHFIPIEANEDVIAVVAAERRHPGRFAAISENAKAFVSKFLTRDMAKYYTAQLLRHYAILVDTPPETRARPIPRFDMLVHVQNHGDVLGYVGNWTGLRGSGLAVEGFAIWPAYDMSAKDFSYQVLAADDTLSDPVTAGHYCGSRGRSEAIRGLRFWLCGEAAKRWKCVVWARFTDASEVGPVESGDLCCAPVAASIEAIRVCWSSTSGELGRTSGAEAPIV